MAQDFQRILEDNLCLKKNYHVARQQNQKLHNQLSQLRLAHQQLQQSNSQLNQKYTKLMKKHQLDISQHQKNIGNMTANIQQLKHLIDQKQLQLDNFQIKMIPNLDEDMVRVKLIAQMEGPYQQTVDKKDKQIDRLKERLSQIDRKYHLCQMQLETKQKEWKRQSQSQIRFYSVQNEKLVKELNLALARKQIKSYDKEMIKNQRKELQQLKCTLEIHSKNEAELRKQLSSVKLQKEKLFIEIAQLKQKKAMDEYLSDQNQKIRDLKHQIQKIQQKLQDKTGQIQKLNKKMRISEDQHREQENSLRKTHLREHEEWKIQKQTLSEELRHTKFDAKKAKEQCEHLQRQIQELRSQSHNNSPQSQIARLRQEIADLQRQLQLAKKENDFNRWNQHQHGKKPPNHNQGNQKENNQQQLLEKIKELQKANNRLKQKLQEANKKIVELLRQKGARPQQPQNTNQRSRFFSHFERPQSDKTLLLQYRDTSFTPIVQPTIFTKIQ